MPVDFHNLFSVNKLQYIKEKSTGTGCILCSIANRDTDVVNLVVAEGKKTAVCVNRFPYNSGHLLIFPKRHITDYRDFLEEEELEINKFLRASLDVLDSTYSPSGYNFGYNTGEFAGASISHLHMHVIPRYRNELGFIDIIGGAKILVENPAQTMKKLKKAFGKIS
ncbi:MAG TPA: HIT domain-containing protein [Spirochaetes bacterium]|nr:HIT domain-containing protein [Spirochaetota bacterium]